MKYTNNLHSKALQNLPNLGFLVWKYTIWQPWLYGAVCQTTIYCKCLLLFSYDTIVPNSVTWEFFEWTNLFNHTSHISAQTRIAKIVIIALTGGLVARNFSNQKGSKCFKLKIENDSTMHRVRHCLSIHQNFRLLYANINAWLVF
jgi:hypothetical protein